MRLKLEFRDKSRPNAIVSLAKAEALIPYDHNTFHLEDIPMLDRCDSIEFRLSERSLTDETFLKSALNRAQDFGNFDYRYAPQKTNLMKYLDYMVDNLARDQGIKPADVQVVATSYPLNGAFTGAVHRIEEVIAGDEGPETVQKWVKDETLPYGQQYIAAPKVHALTA